MIAWLLGWKSNPLALHYGSVFGGNHGVQAALVAASGPFLGNGVTAIICHRLILRRINAPPNRSSWFILWALIWFDAFATFNVWSYAPLRTLAKGLGLSIWELFPFAGAFGGWLLWRLLNWGKGGAWFGA